MDVARCMELCGGSMSFKFKLGEFVVPPAKAEEMYSPETFGRSATDRVIVR